MWIRSSITTFFLLYHNVVSAQDIDALLKKVDELYRADTSQTIVEMQIKTPNWDRSLKMEIWTKGMDYTFITILEPKKDQGISTLKRDAEMWNYFPKINKVIKIPPSMMMGSWMGSDFTNDDLVKENTMKDDFHAKLGAGNDTEYQIILTPKKETVTVWGKVELWIDKKSSLPIRQDYFDEKGEKIRELVFSEVKELGGKSIPATLTLLPLKKKGNKTVIRYLSASFNKPLHERIFTRKNLQKRR